MKYRKIEVTWRDHHECHGQGQALTPEALQPMLWKSTGYLLSENDEMIEMARDVSAGSDVTDVGAALRIMKNSIVKRSDKRG